MDLCTGKVIHQNPSLSLAMCSAHPPRKCNPEGLGTKLTWIHCYTATATTYDTESQLATTKCLISRQLYLNWLLAEWQNVFRFCHTESDCTVEAGTSTFRRSSTHHGHLFPHGFQVAAAHCCVNVLAKFSAALKPRVLSMLKLAVTCRRQATVSRYVAWHEARKLHCSTSWAFRTYVLYASTILHCSIIQPHTKSPPPLRELVNSCLPVYLRSLSQIMLSCIPTVLAVRAWWNYE